jgi:hypothetical protein
VHTGGVFRIEPQANGSKLTVFIDYAPPESGLQRFLGRLFGKFYAQWCTERMVRDAVAHGCKHRQYEQLKLGNCLKVTVSGYAEILVDHH